MRIMPAAGRTFLPATIAAFAAALLSWGVAMPTSAEPPRIMSARAAHEAALAGDVVLVDIRTPEEWRETGIPASAHAIDTQMEPRAFLQRLDVTAVGDRTRRIALICRTGNRSSYLQTQLTRAGYTNIVDVAEGVAGSRSGSGWLKAGLPVRPGREASLPPSTLQKADTK
jgi:rhodanese-related sulfurtransferase